MNTELAEKTRVAARQEACGMINENWDEVLAAYSEALIASNPESKFKFPVAIAIALEPKEGNIEVSAKISFAVKHSDESEGVLCDSHPQLPGLEDAE